METSKRLAEGVLRHATDYNVQHGKNAYNECNFCRGYVYWDEDAANIEHDPDCLVLVAKATLEV